MAPGAELFLATTETVAETQSAIDWFVANGVSIITRSLGAPYDGPGDGTGPLDSLVDYAAALKVSESRLRHACMIVAAQSPMQLVHARVVLEAKRQLRYTSGSVSEIAYALGFDDPAYFTRFFSRRTGMSPRAFRALALRPDEPGG